MSEKKEILEEREGVSGPRDVKGQMKLSESGSVGDSRLPLETEGCSRSDKAVPDAAFKTYVCRYFHDGSWWGLNIMASDYQDAEARVVKLGNLQLLGELGLTIPASVPTWIVRAICTLRNFFGGRP